MGDLLTDVESGDDNPGQHLRNCFYTVLGSVSREIETSAGQPPLPGSALHEMLTFWTRPLCGMAAVD
jgi:hypothetical protein